VEVSVVIPCYNSQSTIVPVVEAIHDVMRNYPPVTSYEIILINDDSQDATESKLRALCADSHVKAISLARNFGQHAALMAGFHEVEGDIIVCLDDDGQTVPDQIPLLLERLDEQTDVVYAAYDDGHQSAWRRFGSRVNDRMTSSFLGKPADLKVTSFFAARRFVIDEVIKYPNPYPYIIGLILRATRRIVNVRVQHNERISGKSGYSVAKLVSLWMNGVTSFSVRPLRLATIVGMFLAMVGLGFLLYLVVQKLLHPGAVLLGWSSLISVSILGNGVVMMMIGVVGEYLGRVFISINRIPQYVVRTRLTRSVILPPEVPNSVAHCHMS